MLLEELLQPGHGGPQQLQRLLNFIGWGGPTSKDPSAIRIGVLGASQVATYALIWPAKRRTDVVVAAVAARDAGRAQQYAKQHGIPQAYGSYQELIDDPSLTAIYVATPNGLHGAWAAAALQAGKHVLCEKPFAANASEAREVQGTAAKKKLLCREAFHYKEHPANKTVANLLQSGAIGQLKQLEAKVLIPAYLFNKNDIRFKAKLAGGTAMDAGCYCAHSLRFFPGCSRPRVLDAAASKLVDGRQIDGRMTATLTYPCGSSSSSGSAGALAAGAVGVMEADLRHEGLWPTTHFIATGTKGRLEMKNFIMPPVGHSISLTRLVTDPTSRDNPDRQPGVIGDNLREVKQTLEVYGSGESNYYYQLDRFISDLKVLEDKAASKEAKRAVQAAMRADADDAIDNMQLVDSIYQAAGMPIRQPSSYFLTTGSAEARSQLPAGTKCGGHTALALLDGRGRK